MDLINQPPEIRLSDGSEVLLAGRVPNLQLEPPPAALGLFGAEVDSDGWVQRTLELVLGELEQETGFPDVGVAYEDVFEHVSVICHALIGILMWV